MVDAGRKRHIALLARGDEGSSAGARDSQNRAHHGEGFQEVGSRRSEGDRHERLEVRRYLRRDLMSGLISLDTSRGVWEANVLSLPEQAATDV